MSARKCRAAPCQAASSWPCADAEESHRRFVVAEKTLTALLGRRRHFHGGTCHVKTLPPSLALVLSRFVMSSYCRDLALSRSLASSRSRARALSLSALLCLVSYSLLSHGSSFSPPPRAKLGAVEGALALHPTSCYCDHAATPPPHSMLHSSPPLSPPEFAPTPFTPHDCTTFTWLGWLSPI